MSPYFYVVTLSGNFNIHDSSFVFLFFSTLFFFLLLFDFFFSIVLDNVAMQSNNKNIYNHFDTFFITVLKIGGAGKTNEIKTNKSVQHHESPPTILINLYFDIRQGENYYLISTE